MMSKMVKVLVSVLVTVVLLTVGGTARVVLAADNGDDSQPKTLLARVAEILGIDQQNVEDAFAQAQSEMRDEALDSYLQNMVGEGKITQEEADQYKAWLQARPDMEPYRQQLQEWQEASPDMPLPGCFGGHGLRGGMKRGGGRYFWGR
ncbi:hypothetical protein ACFLUU_09405 [Chloroflexota bacterium]